jgi:PAS domain S-box-containing protein
MDEDWLERSKMELFQMLFENANDPQYVLDLKSQAFLEANPAFLALSGYSKELEQKLQVGWSVC